MFIMPPICDGWFLTPGIPPNNEGWFSSTTHTTNLRLVVFRCIKNQLLFKKFREKISVYP